MQFKLPPVLYNQKGDVRTVGFELEYSNVGVEESVQVIQQLYGGTVQKENRFKQKVNGTLLGDFTVEFDLTLLTEKRYKKLFETFNIHIEDVKFGNGTLEDEIEENLERVIAKVFPYEIACPPVPCNHLHQLEKLREELYRHHAEGTNSFPTNAFGTHINVETPGTDTGTLIAYLKAFLLLYPWLLEIGKTDLARKISPFIDPYPDGYVALVLDHGYKPDMEHFVTDYHAFNPNRNRPLDMYPLIASQKSEMLTQFKDLGKVKARNTFHYRLPNSSVAQPEWTLAEEWNNWIHVEELANDPARLALLSEEYLALKERTFIGFEGKWAKKMKQELLPDS